MAKVGVEGDDVVVALSREEKLEAIHGDVRFSAQCLRAVEVIDQPIHLVKGMKLPGTRIPGVTAVGTFVEAGRRTFAAIHHHSPRGLRLVLDGGPFDEVVLGLDDPEAAAHLLEQVRQP